MRSLCSKTILSLSASILLAWPGQGRTSPDFSLNYDYMQHLDDGVAMYRRGQYAQARDVFLHIFTQPDGQYYPNPVVFRWLVAAMIKGGASRSEVIAFCRQVILNSPGGPAVKEARALITKLTEADKPKPEADQASVPIPPGFQAAVPVPALQPPAPEAPQPKPDGISKAQQHYQQGRTQFQQGNYRGAIAELNLAIQFKPDFAQAYHQRGKACYALGNHREAVTSYTSALVLNPKSVAIYTDRGLAYRAMGHKASAAADFRKAAELDQRK